jgi:hypothetical protein
MDHVGATGSRGPKVVAKAQRIDESAEVMRSFV